MTDVRALLIAATETLDAQVREAILAEGTAAVPPLLELLLDPDLEQDDAPGAGWAPIHAARLLGELRAPEAAVPLLSVFKRSGWDDVIHDAALLALHRLGAPALAPTLRALEVAPDDERRDDLCAVLGSLGVRDERAFQHLCALFARDPVRGAMELGQYGDARALPLLSEKLEGHQVRLDALRVDGLLVEVTSAIEELGGERLPAHEALLERMAALRAEALAPREKPAAKAPQTPRNQACWCGSGKKYKKCHLAADEAKR